jgi:hypothetical protein
MHELPTTIPQATLPTLRVSRRSLRAVAFAILYAAFVVLFPWDVIQRVGFADFDNYVQDFNYYSSVNLSRSEMYQLSTIREYFISEVLWDDLARTLTSLTGEAEIALRIISFFILLVWGVFLFKRMHQGVALLFLFNPTAIDVAMSGIRNGLGWSLAIIGLSVRSKALRFALFLTGSFIHSTTLILLALYYGTHLLLRMFKGRTPLIGAVGAGVAVGLALTIGNELVLGAIGDRRSGDEYVVGGGSFLQASIWGVLLLLMCASGREYIRRNVFVAAVLAWYLTMNPFIPWSFRVWGALLPVIAVSALELPKLQRQLFLSLYSGYLVLWYIYWTKLLEYFHLG